MMQQIPEWLSEDQQENQNEEAHENDDEDGETPDKPDDEDHEMEGETLAHVPVIDSRNHHLCNGS